MPRLSHTVVPRQTRDTQRLRSLSRQVAARQAATALWYEGVSRVIRSRAAAHGRKAGLAITATVKARRRTSANTTYSIAPTALTGESKGA